MKAADPYDDIIFAHTFDPKLKIGKSKIVLYKNFDEILIKLRPQKKLIKYTNKYSNVKKNLFSHEYNIPSSNFNLKVSERNFYTDIWRDSITW